MNFMLAVLLVGGIGLGAWMIDAIKEIRTVVYRTAAQVDQIKRMLDS